MLSRNLECKNYSKLSIFIIRLSTELILNLFPQHGSCCRTLITYKSYWECRTHSSHDMWLTIFYRRVSQCQRPACSTCYTFWKCFSTYDGIFLNIHKLSPKIIFQFLQGMLIFLHFFLLLLILWIILSGLRNSMAGIFKTLTLSLRALTAL